MLVAPLSHENDASAHEDPRAADIRVLALDIDGVLTDGTVNVLRDAGEAEVKRIALRDLDAVSKWKKNGFQLALVTGEGGSLVDAIASRLCADFVVKDEKDKVKGLVSVANHFGIGHSALCFVGDADRDALAFDKIGLSMTPCDGSEFAKSRAQVILKSHGGHGAVAEAVELLLFRKRVARLENSHKQMIEDSLKASVRAHQRMLDAGASSIAEIASILIDCLSRGGKVLLCGNGGSAADAQHAAAELVGRFHRDRAALPALSLSTDSSVLTAVGNDWDFDDVFARQVQALARPGDVVVGLSTSGRSNNVVRALRTAEQLGAIAVGLTGHEGRDVEEACSTCFCVPSDSTPRIQELHILALHTICELVESALFSEPLSLTEPL